MGRLSEYDDDDRNMILGYEREESRDARRFAPETVTAGDCSHVGGIRRGATACSWCGEGP